MVGRGGVVGGGGEEGEAGAGAARAAVAAVAAARAAGGAAAVVGRRGADQEAHDADAVWFLCRVVEALPPSRKCVASPLAARRVFADGIPRVGVRKRIPYFT